jgi:hypothetical protein
MGPIARSARACFESVATVINGGANLYRRESLCPLQTMSTPAKPAVSSIFGVMNMSQAPFCVGVLGHVSEGVRVAATSRACRGAM